MIGCYPGSFNPPTVAHLAVAESAVEQAGLDRLDLVDQPGGARQGGPVGPDRRRPRRRPRGRRRDPPVARRGADRRPAARRRGRRLRRPRPRRRQVGTGPRPGLVRLGRRSRRRTRPAPPGPRGAPGRRSSRPASRCSTSPSTSPTSAPPRCGPAPPSTCSPRQRRSTLAPARGPIRLATAPSAPADSVGTSRCSLPARPGARPGWVCRSGGTAGGLGRRRRPSRAGRRRSCDGSS